MKIARRLSGGRGEYELAGEYEGLKPSDVYTLEAKFSVPGFILSTGLTVVDQGGKPRFKRLTQDRSSMQVQRQLAALLLMPKPTRADDALGSAQTVMIEDEYALDSVELLSVRIDGPSFIMEPGVVHVKNQSVEDATFDARQRFSRVRTTWSTLKHCPESVQKALEEHRAAVMVGGPLEASVEDQVEVIVDWAGGDPLGNV